MKASVLADRHRRVVGALAQALLAIPPQPAWEAAEQRRDSVDELVDGFDAHIAAVSPSLRRLLLLSVDWVRWLPLLLFLAWRPFDELSLDRRTTLLERMDRSRSPLLFLPLVAYKTLLSMMHFERAVELRAMGYLGSGVASARRRLAVDGANVPSPGAGEP
jgi:hypothetical protein